MEENKICVGQSLLYESYALFLEAKGKLLDAFMVYQIGVSRFFIPSLSLSAFIMYAYIAISGYFTCDLLMGIRKAEPLDKLKKAQALFMDRMKEIVNACSLEPVC